MAEEPTTGDSAQESVEQTTETTAAGATSEQKADPYEARFAALQAQTERAQRAADGAARLVHQRDSELNRLRQENARYQNQTQDYGTDQQTSAPQQRGDNENLSARLHLMEFKQLHPDWRDRLSEMQEVSQDPLFTERFGGDLGSRVTFEAAYEAAENRKLRAEMVTLRAAQDKLDQAKKIRKDQAFVSGQGASPQSQAIDREALMKMTPEEMEKKFGKNVLARGYF
jgi:hypothetical protein